jgi:hypothetical protein
VINLVVSLARHLRKSVLLPDAPNVSAEAGEAPPEASPFWPLLLALAEIASRVDRRQAEEHAVSDDEAAA